MQPSETEALETRLVLEAIFSQYGYDFRGYGTASMGRRLSAVLARTGVPHLGELQHRIVTEPEFFVSVLDDLTVQVSEMFRDPQFYRTLREQVVPLLRTYPELKIWHAGCASGEEVYTTAILLAEEDLSERTQIYATDVSARALERARAGVYPEARVPAFSANYVASGGKRSFEDYYSSAYGGIVVREWLRKQVVFFQHDLVSDYALGEMHVILCRNVLLYFGPALRERVLDLFAGSLCRSGFLCLGGSEAIPSSSAHLFGDFSSAQRIYRRRAEA
jgi:chemotaxis protein methyltransferase CheR